MKPKILLVEDDEGLSELIRYNLEADGAVLRATGDGDEALLLADYEQPDVIILDWMIEGISGIEVCRRLRRMPSTATVPIIMLTARGEESDRIRGLETGADDYMVKPFSPRELVARVNAILRRLRPALAGVVLNVAGLEMDTVSHKVSRNGIRLQLGPTEFRLLRHFLQHPGRVFSREQLLTAVWGSESDVEARTVDVHIRRLRKAINLDGQPDLIRTVRSAGYALEEGVES